MVTCQVCYQTVEEVEDLIIMHLIFILNGIYLIFVSRGFLSYKGDAILQHRCKIIF